MSEEPNPVTSAHPADRHTGHPITSTSIAPLTSTNTALGLRNDGAHTGTTPSTPRRKQRMQPRDIHELASWLSERDIGVLRSVAEHQFLTVSHIEALHFANHAPISGPRIARRTLARLRDLRLLGTLKRHIGGVRAGSAGLVHYVDSVGDRLLHERSGRLAHRRGREPSSRFLSHRLAVANAHVALVQAHRKQQFELVECAVEPASWRRFIGPAGARLALKTDLCAETAVPPGSEFVHAWFVEVDLGTEHIPTLLKKCRDYETYRRTGIEQDQGGGFPFVVWSMTHADPEKAEQRRQALREAIDRDSYLMPQLFRIIAPEQLILLLQAGGQQ